jgi:photosystem II stability/assembly factor-like uncharacterized protein
MPNLSGRTAGGQTTKKLLFLLSFALLAAGCNPFAKPLPAGVIKTVNGGVDWQFANTINNATNGASLTSLNISRLAFDPANRQTVFAGSYTDGMYKSVDAASTWSNVLSDIEVYDLAVNPDNSQIIYAAGYYAGHGRVLETTNGGGSWNQIYNEASANNTVRAISINPQNTSEIVIGTALGSVIKSADGGQTWQLVNNYSDKVNQIIWQGGDYYVLLQEKGLFEYAGFDTASTTDVTESLNSAYGPMGLSFSQNAINSFNQFYVDSDTPTLIYVATDKGLYKTTDGGANWALQTLPVQPGQSSTQAVAVASSDSNIVYTSVGSTVYKSLDGGQTWQTQAVNTTGLVNYLLVDPDLPQIVYGGIYLATSNSY